jgi:hypothetical protein
MSVTSISPSGQNALLHLKKLKPYDGWHIESRSSTKDCRLLRRSIPLTDHYFRDIHFDSTSGFVVGIIAPGNPTHAQALVDSKGKVMGKTPVSITVTTWPTKATTLSSSTQARQSSIHASSRRTTIRATSEAASISDTFTASTLSDPSLSDEQNRALVQYACYAIACAIVLRLLMTAFLSVSIFLVPAGYLYAIQTLPSLESFEPKKELKRVLRGAHLPEDHAEKPKGWIQETLARATASIVAEVSTGLGYECQFQTILGVAHLVTVTVPAVSHSYTWIGVLGKWRYLPFLDTDTTTTS